MPRRKTYTVNEILDALDDEDDEEFDVEDVTSYNMVLFPPNDEPGEDSAGDSDDSDSPLCQVGKISKNLLQARTNNSIMKTNYIFICRWSQSSESTKMKTKMIT